MEAPAPAERTITQLDHARLTNLIHRHKRARPDPTSPWQIEHVLEEATIVPWRLMPPGTVTMHSQVLLKCQCNGEQAQLTLCYPPDANPEAGKVSVLSTLGWSLLGQHIGTRVDWPSNNGGPRFAEILEVLFQPESSGVVAK